MRWVNKYNKQIQMDFILIDMDYILDTIQSIISEVREKEVTYSDLHDKFDCIHSMFENDDSFSYYDITPSQYTAYIDLKDALTENQGQLYNILEELEVLYEKLID